MRVARPAQSVNNRAMPSRRPWRRPRLPFRPIVGGFVLAAAAVTAAAAWLLTDRLHWPVLLGYLAGINVTTFAAYLYDKSVARRDPAGAIGRLWRVPESALHLLAVAGGTVAAFAGQRLLRHKTHKQPFRAWFWTIAVVQFLALSAWVWHANFRRR